MKTALIVIDMQKYFQPMVLDSIKQVLVLSEYFRQNNMTQIFTQHGHTGDELTGKVVNQLVRKWGAEGSIARESDEWQLIPAIENAWQAAGSPEIIHKNTYDAFINTDLEARLRSSHIGRVVVTGVMTDCCCDTTARSAFNRGFETWLVSNACGSANRTQHQAGLKGFGFAFGEVIDSDTVIERLMKE